MQRRAWSVVLAGLIGAVGLSACGDGNVVQPPTKVDFKIVRLAPDAVYVDGGETITLETENGCDAPAVKVAGLPVEVEKVSENRYTFLAPPAPDRNIRAAVRHPLEATCTQHPGHPGTIYGNGAAEAHLTYDPNLEPHPTVSSFSPTGDRVSVFSPVVVVFSRAMNRDSILEPGNIVVEGVLGTVTCAEANACRTVTLTPSGQLDFGRTYTVRVRGGDRGVKSAAEGKTLRTTLTPRGVVNPNEDVWEFTTRRLNDEDPWVGGTAAAAGFAQSTCDAGDPGCTRYKLFSVTGQPAPVGVGEATDGSMRMESGFIFRTQPSSGN